MSLSPPLLSSFCPGSARLFCNEILANSRPGVVVCRGGVASLARNKIHSGREEGVWVCERSAAVLVENEVHIRDASRT